MKIAFIRQRYAPIGGAERYLDALMGEMAARGHEVHLFTNAWSAGGRSGLQVHHVPMWQGTSFMRMISFARACQRELDKVRPELVFSLERTLRQDIYRAGDGCHREWLRQRKRYLGRWKTMAVAANPFHRAALRLEKKLFSPARTKIIIANSRRGKEEIVKHYRFPAEAIHVIYGGVDGRRFVPGKSTTPDEGALLFAGSGFERKGLRFCLQALERLPEKFKLRVAGKGNARPYRRLAEQLGVSGRVEFLGPVADLAPVYQGSGLLVHPAIYEPFANVCLEAMACGVPVITSRINGASEIIEPGRNGAILERPDDAEALAKAIQLLAAQRTAAGMAARATAEQFPLSQNVSATLEVIAHSLGDASI